MNIHLYSIYNIDPVKYMKLRLSEIRVRKRFLTLVIIGNHAYTTLIPLVFKKAFKRDFEVRWRLARKVLK